MGVTVKYAKISSHETLSELLKGVERMEKKKNMWGEKAKKFLRWRKKIQVEKKNYEFYVTLRNRVGQKYILERNLSNHKISAWRV